MSNVHTSRNIARVHAPNFNQGLQQCACKLLLLHVVTASMLSYLHACDLILHAFSACTQPLPLYCYDDNRKKSIYQQFLKYALDKVCVRACGFAQKKLVRYLFDACTMHAHIFCSQLQQHIIQASAKKAFSKHITHKCFETHDKKD